MTPENYTQSDWASLLTAMAEDLRQARDSPHDRDEPLWQEIRRRLLAHALYLERGSTAARADVDDVVQNVLVKLQRPEVLNELLRKRAPGGYIAIMVRNALIDVIRHHQRDQSSLDRYRHDYSSSSEEDAEEDDEQRLSQLRRIVSRLPLDDQALLRERFWKNMSIKAMAESAGVKYSTVAVRLFRLLRRLHRELDGNKCP